MNWCNQSWSKQPSCFCSDVTVQCKFPMEPFNTQGASYDHMYWLSISSASELTILRVQVFFAVQTQQKSHLNTTQFCLYLAIGDTTVSFNQITAIYMQWSSLYANLEVLTYLICKIQAADCACECQEIDAYNDTNKQTDCSKFEGCFDGRKRPRLLNHCTLYVEWSMWPNYMDTTVNSVQDR